VLKTRFTFAVLVITGNYKNIPKTYQKLSNNYGTGFRVRLRVFIRFRDRV